MQKLLRVFADDGGIWRHRWSDQSTFPLVLGTFNAKIAQFAGAFVCIQHECLGSGHSKGYNYSGYGCRPIPVGSNCPMPAPAGFQTYHVVSPIFKEVWHPDGWCRDMPVEGEVTTPAVRS